MKTALFLAPLTALALSTVPVQAAPNPRSSAEASIPFVSLGGVDDWRADGNKVVYFRDVHRQWYRATLMSPAFDLPFTEHVGVDARGTDRLDKWASVIVRGQRYPIESFVKVDGPPVKHKPAAKPLTPNA